MLQRIIFIILLFPLVCAPVSAIDISSSSANRHIAKNENLRSFFNVLSSGLKKPIIVSKLVARKIITGNFSLDDPQALLEKIAPKLGLIWYNDGQAIYIYDDSELRSAVITLSGVSYNSFTAFLRKSGLYDPRYPLRGDNINNTFYISGPPVLVDLVVKAANIMDKKNEGIELGQQKIAIIHLKNTFVDDRSYNLRDQSVVVPGITTVIEKLLHGDNQSLQPISANFSIPQSPDSTSRNMPDFPSPDQQLPLTMHKDNHFAGDNSSADKIKVVAYPDTNSLLIRGTNSQVAFIEKLVEALDVAKRHIELSLWIIDLSKGDLAQLGATYSGGINFGNKFSLTFNNAGSISTLDTIRFRASLQALEQQKKATVVSRPVLLTQENIPAIFDNNHTFYAKLIGERDVKLEHVTYGTLISVIPRISSNNEIEMSLNIEDGQQQGDAQGSDSLPEVGRTVISTVARVPEGKSLLIGGYTRDANVSQTEQIPLLGDIPLIGRLFQYKNNNKSNTVRVFLIQPKIISSPLSPNANEIADSVLQQAGINNDALEKFVRSYLDRSNNPLKYK